MIKDANLLDIILLAQLNYWRKGRGKVNFKLSIEEWNV